MQGIYKITNKINNKAYIGKSTNIDKRWERHKSSSYRKEKSQVIHKAIDKYGIENFIFEVLEECSLEEIDEKEKFYIEKYDSFNKGYNCSFGGDGASEGEANVNALINDELAKEIKILLAQRYSAPYISKKLNVSCNIIYDIKRNKTWNHIRINEEKIEKIKDLPRRKSAFKKLNETTKNEIISLRKQGFTVPQIMKTLNLEGVISKSGIYGILRRNK